MSNVFIGALNPKTKLKKNHYFDYNDMNKYFMTPEIVRLLNEAQNWLNKGTQKQYIKKLNSLKYQKYLQRYDKIIEKITLKMGIDPTSANYYSNFGDYMS